ncbi:hypothetical protein J6590_041378 [Homalodisca vitripennis]|nr:hypothetical protein J6590_041378 [Homalodisca vitripennis]
MMSRDLLHTPRAVHSAHWITATGLAGLCGDYEPRSVAHASCSAQCTLDNGYRISRSLRAHWITATGLAGLCGDDEPRSVAHGSCSAQCTLDNGYRISRSLR